MVRCFGVSVSASLVMLAVIVASPPIRATAGVYDNVAAWWHFDYDANTNGIAETDEIRDQRDWGSVSTKGTGGRHAQLTTGLLGAPTWTNAVFSPAGGSTYGRLSMAFNPITNATSCWPDTFKLADFVINGSATIVTRFRWDGYAFNSGNAAWLYNNGTLWANSGWMFGIQAGVLSVLSGSAQASANFGSMPVSTGTWYEAAAVITENGASDTVEVFLLQAGGSIKSSKTTTLALTNTASLSTGTIIGAEAASSGYATGNALKAFKGAVNHIAVWNRALSSSEVAEAFCNPRPLIQLGIKNNSPYDLAWESEADADYFPGDPWNTMRRAVTATVPEATIRLPLASYQSQLSYVFHVRPMTWNNLSAEINLIVNSFTNPVQAVSHLKDLYWFVPANQLVTGTNTFTLCYGGGASSYVAFDWMELGGAWQVGFEDKLASEFEHESSAPDDFYVTDPNWKHVERAIVNAETNTQVRFFISEELARKYTFNYVTRIVGQGNGADTHAFSVDFNNRLLKSFQPVPNDTYIKLPLDRTLVQAGENVIRVRYDDNPSIAGYLQFDFHRLEINPWPAGTVLRMR